jgi:hypothetical protein
MKDSGTLLGVIFIVMRLAVLAGLVYFAIVEIKRERRKK